MTESRAEPSGCQHKETHPMSAETREKEVADGIATRLISGGWVATVYPMIVKDWQNAITKAISDAECDTEERCYAASEELCAKIAEMHDEIARLRTLIQKD